MPKSYPDVTPAQMEKSKPDFDTLGILHARRKTFEAMNKIAAAIQPGMLEEDGYELAKTVLAESGAEKQWHRPYVRFGKNTLKMYGEVSEPGVRLGQNDVFFLDVGPVYEGYEGDAGDTYVVGDDAEMLRCASDARALFEIVKAEWKHEKKSGFELYDFADRKAKEMGWKLNLNVNGHRISDFPHALHFKGALTDVKDFRPAPHIWVLEIQITHPTRSFGAFYEDILY